MKITIDLNPKEVNAIKAYLKEISPDIEPKITKEEIMAEIQGAIAGHLQAGALGDYYKIYCLNTIPKSFFK